MVNIFSYEELRNKACREIDRLVTAETNKNENDARDYALNAAFTIYHLLEWEYKKNNPNIKKKVKVLELLEDKNNDDLKILHCIVTRNKHVNVTVDYSHGSRVPMIQELLGVLATEDGRPIATEDGCFISTGEIFLKVYFGDKKALDVLKNAFTLFPL